MSTSATSSSNGNSRIAIVTGGTANLGKLFAESLAGDGVNLVVHYNSPHRAQEAADVVNELEALGVEAIAHQDHAVGRRDHRPLREVGHPGEHLGADHPQTPGRDERDGL